MLYSNLKGGGKKKERDIKKSEESLDKLDQEPMLATCLDYESTSTEVQKGILRAGPFCLRAGK